MSDLIAVMYAADARLQRALQAPTTHIHDSP
jgi:hypothetical protein